MYVGPKDQIEIITNVLSNKAECELRLGRYHDAAKTATDALVYLNQHKKSRIRRSKAQFAIAKQRGDKLENNLRYIVQARTDLMALHRVRVSAAASEIFKTMFPEVNEECARIKVDIWDKRPNFDYDTFVCTYQKKCMY